MKELFSPIKVQQTHRELFLDPLVEDNDEDLRDG